MKFKLFAVLFIATASFEILEATDLSLLQQFMENELPPRNGVIDYYFPEGNRTKLSSIPICPREIQVSWQLKPPFTLEKYSKEDQPQLNGILHQALEFALEQCCNHYWGNKTIMRYLAMSDNSSALQRMAHTEDPSLSFPFQADWYIGGSRRYINVFDSPGIVIIRRGPAHTTTERQSQLLKAILGAWPIVVLSLLMSSLAGICIWMLDNGKNEEEFSRPFYRGAFDGFWWAFVTMSTVGYGDKTPKSISGRLFSVVWIMTGITVCSILTATLSSALTNVTVSVERYDVTTGKTIGVPRESIAFKRAVNLGINITDFQSLHEAYYSLKDGKVDGIIEEMFTAVEFIKRKSNSELSIAQFFEEKHGFGAAIKEVGFSEDVLVCLSKVTEFVSVDIYSNASAFLKSLRNQDMTPTTKNLEQNDPSKNDYSVFDQNSSSFQATALGISVALFMFIACSTGFAGVRYLRRRRPKKEVVDLEEVEKGL